jgi:hypothetical protein
MQAYVPMSFRFSPDIHGWIAGSASKMSLSPHRFVIELVEGVKTEMDQPDGQEQMPKILLKLRAMSKIEEATARPWRNADEQTPTFQREGDQLLEVRRQWSLSSQKPQEKQPRQNIREHRKTLQKKKRK